MHFFCKCCQYIAKRDTGSTSTVREAKRVHPETLQQQFSVIDSASVCRGLGQIKNFKPKAPHTNNDSCLANDMNEYYCRFERLNPPDQEGPGYREPPLSFTTDPDSVSPSTLKHCTDQLSPVSIDIFNTLLETCLMPARFKISTIVLVPPKKDHRT